VIADTVGRRASFLLSIAILGLSTLAYVGLAQIESGILAFSAVSVLLGLGFTFYSGAMEAWLVDGIRHHGFTGELDQVFSRGQIVTGAAMLVGTVSGGGLGQIDLAIPFLVRAGLLAVLFVIAFVGMHDVGFTTRTLQLSEIPVEASKVAADGVRFGWRNRSLRLLMIVAAIQGGFMAWAWYAWQPYFLELLGRDAVWVAGVVAALLAISMMIGNGIVEIVMRWCGRRSTLFIGAGGVFSLALVGVGAVNSFAAALALLFVGGVTMGVQAPVRQAFVHRVVPSDRRATVVSFDSMVSGGGSVVGQTGLGALSDRQGFSAGYVIGGAVTLISLPLLLRVRRHNDPADLYTGRLVENACPIPAVPAISQVSSDAVVSDRSSA
jgi:MFS family permease